MPIFKSCPNLKLNPGNTCVGEKISCIYPGLDYVTVCGTQCPSIYPQKNANWIFPKDYQNSLGECKTFDEMPIGTGAYVKSYNTNLTIDETTNELSNKATTSPFGNANQVTWKGIITAQWYEGSGTSSDPGEWGYFCSIFSLINLEPTKTAKGFIITFDSCPKLVKITATWGYPVFETPSSFQMIGTGIWIDSGEQIEIGGWCMNVNNYGNNLFRFNKHFTFGVDLYGETPNCTLNDCKIFCGNGVCDVGETATNCPIDCNKMVCS